MMHLDYKYMLSMMPCPYAGPPCADIEERGTCGGDAVVLRAHTEHVSTSMLNTLLQLHMISE